MAVDIDEAKVTRNEFGLWLGWTLATAAGTLLGFLPFAFVIENLDLLVVRLLIPLWAGFLVGLLQWLVLRRFLTHSVDWILNGGAGWALGYALGLLVIQLFSETFLGALLGYVLFGLIIATLQWPVLRREIPSVAPWVIASILGWSLGAYLSQVILSASFPDSSPPQALITAISSGMTGLVAGAVTGLALVWIVRQPER